MQKLTFITGNTAKAKYLSDYFHMPVAHVKLDLKEIQSLDLEEVVRDKAQRAFAVVGGPALLEDVSLVFTTLKSLPGPLIKWFYESLGNEGLCRLLDGSADLDTVEARAARAEVAFAICDKQGVHVFSGSVDGTIATTPRGKTGFGWDPIFIPVGYTQTWSEMSDDKKHETSMRRIALEKVAEFLKN